jgi:outer membrane biosynthesis protein TonB
MAIDYPEPHRREALIGTLVVHGVLLLLFMFTFFKGPNPPLASLGGGDGVELNYGLDPAGSGDIQSMAPANASQNREDSRPPKASPDPTPRPVADATPDPTPPSQEKIITSDAEESPVSEAPVEKAAPPKEEVKVVPKPKRQVAVAFSPNGNATGGGNGVNGTSNTPTGNSNGDRPGTVGDQGDPNGSLDAKALYGSAGRGGSGSSPGSGGLEMSGWRFESTPVVEALDDNSGQVRFKIKISADGEVESVTKVSGNVSAAQEKACRDKLLDANFIKTNGAAGGATGFYTFKIIVR